MATQQNNPLRAAIAAELRAVVARSDLTQEQVAEAAGLSRATVNRLLKGQRSVDSEQLIAIATALGFDPGEVLDQARDRYLKQLARENPEAQGSLDN